ncbi:Transglutaminase-like enzyme, putative cysteine protease [Verrucomicrobium sp. GAS474]|uniref:transglutaminase family protein n=1 Tax=Verrucomicrobium sp. GAS474 TaxID=1882831 RepID=UPI00087DD94B|nr:transglutaminase family protein [Verrucomicrobium sp. GAS474]SDT85944.1 Transglutaminase-like enzyme, putative cysteine protease [Verrucomicrobium sp. GAS474]
MKFRIVHSTEYEYSAPAIECYSELRVRPRNTMRQVITDQVTEVSPRVPLEVFTDYWGNAAESLSVPFRHKRLIVTSRCTVQTRPVGNPIAGLDLSVSEAVHLYHPRRRELYDFLMPSHHVPITKEIRDFARAHVDPRESFTPALLRLNETIFRTFKYQPGATTISTPLNEVIATKKGVCQDFAHLLIGILRASGIPARYVSGYIETDSQAAASLGGGHANGHGNGHAHRGGDLLGASSRLSGLAHPKETPGDHDPLIGATASHAWVEVCAPNGIWVGLDPTNNQIEGERHVQIGIGRDYADVPPLRGVFKGAQKQVLSVKVTVARTPGGEGAE